MRHTEIYCEAINDVCVQTLIAENHLMPVQCVLTVLKCHNMNKYIRFKGQLCNSEMSSRVKALRTETECIKKPDVLYLPQQHHLDKSYKTCQYWKC